MGPGTAAGALRPHHALCAGFFRGKGYSAAFADNMTAVLEALRASDPLLTLRASADPICAACPHSLGGVCRSAEKTARYDAAALLLTGLRPGDTLRWSELRRRVEENILAPNRLGEVCGDCQWYALCAGTDAERGGSRGA